MIDNVFLFLGPLYENSDVSYTTPSKVVNVSTENESESNITEQQVELPVSKSEEPVVKIYLSAKYSQTCIKRSPLGQRNSGFISQVTS